VSASSVPHGVKADNAAAGPPPIAQAALENVRRGWSVTVICPPDHFGMSNRHRDECGSPGKAPWHPWKALQTKPLTESQVAEYFRRQPRSNTGILTGAVSGLVAIDSDGPEGEALLGQMSGGDLPETLTFRTRNGLRRLYAIPAGVRLRISHHNVKDATHAGVSFLAEGGHTVMPPSRHKDGGVYEWLPDLGPDDIEPAEAPAWLVERLRDDGHRRNGTAHSKGPAAEVGETIPDGERDTTLASLAGTMRRRGMTEGEMAAALLVVNESRCKPPLPEQRVRGIAHSIAQYEPAQAGPTVTIGGAATKTAAEEKADGPRTGCQIILDYFRRRHEPVCRDGNAVRCRNGRMVSMAEACAVADSPLIAALEGATDAPRYKGGALIRDRLPAFFGTWARVAWGDLLATLPDEDEADLEALGSARDEFRRGVRDTMLAEMTIADRARATGKAVEVSTERNSLIGWCARFAKPGPWRAIRGKHCWTRLVELGGGEVVVKVAIRHGIFAQMKADRRLCGMGETKFATRAKRYGVGTSSEADRPCGHRAVVLADDFVSDLLGSPDPELGATGILPVPENGNDPQGGPAKSEGSETAPNW
jgi:hypothetical protein